jgi:diguanylate cyclase (GGDEF)-like protein/PAS domain S-box-containing protein
MTGQGTAKALAALGIGYFGLAVLAVTYLRLENAVSFAWPAGALLLVGLSELPLARWRATLLTCGVAGICALRLGGIGWTNAILSSTGDIAEVLLAARLLHYLAHFDHPVDSPRWIARYFVVLTLIAPLPAALIAAALGLSAGSSPAWHIFRDNMVGHGLGLLLGVPPFSKLARTVSRGTFRLKRERVLRAALCIAAIALVTAISGAFPGVSLLFAPILLLALIAVWERSATVGISMVVLAAIMTTLTWCGSGPLAAMPGPLAAKLHFLQFYLMTSAIVISVITSLITRQRRDLRRLRDSEARYRLVADHSSDIMISTDVQGIVTFISPSITDVTQFEPAQLIGRTVKHLVDPSHHVRLLDAFLNIVTRPGDNTVVEFLGLPLHGDPRWFEGHLRAVENPQGEVVSIVGTIRDISRRKEVEGALSKAAMTDPLTGLANRRQFDLALASCVAKGQSGCIAVLDLDFFKKINDQFGHSAGDQVLQSFARVARQGLRSGDTLARIGGEEFALLLPGTNLETGQMICSRLGKTLARTVTKVDDAQIMVTTSIGLAVIGGDPEAAMHRADRALYQAKSAGRDQLAIAA